MKYIVVENMSTDNAKPFYEVSFNGKQFYSVKEAEGYIKRVSAENYELFTETVSTEPDEEWSGVYHICQVVKSVQPCPYVSKVKVELREC